MSQALPSLTVADDAHQDAPEQEPTPTQPTQPKGIDPKTGEPYEAVAIPVPKRDLFDRLLARAEKTRPQN